MRTFWIIFAIACISALGSEKADFPLSSSASLNLVHVLLEDQSLSQRVVVEGMSKDEGALSASCRVDVVKPNWGEDALASAGNHIHCDVETLRLRHGNVIFLLGDELIHTFGNHFQHHYSFSIRGALADAMLSAIKAQSQEVSEDEGVRAGENKFTDGTLLDGASILSLDARFAFHAIDCMATELHDVQTGS